MPSPLLHRLAPCLVQQRVVAHVMVFKSDSLYFCLRHQVVSSDWLYVWFSTSARTDTARSTTTYVCTVRASDEQTGRIAQNSSQSPLTHHEQP